MRACAISRPSMTAMKRPNNVEEGVRPKEAVLDMLFPFAGQRIAAFGDNLGIPDASSNPFVCIAAYYLLQCNIKMSREGVGPGQTKGPPETGGPEPFRNFA